MTHRLRPPALLAVLAVVVAAVLSITQLGAHAATGGAVTISAVDVSQAPDVTLTVTVDGVLAARELGDEQFTLYVSGEERSARLTGVPSDPMQVELVIDTSGSMQGAPLEAAKAAATTLIDGLPASVAVGIVGFGSAPYPVIDATTDRDALRAAIAGLQSGGETALYDAVGMGTARLAEARRALVVLSDGRDTSSVTTLDAAAAAVAAARATTHVVVLDTPEVDAAAAKALAAAAAGSLVRADDGAALAAAYGDIAGQLSAQYQLTFRAVTTGSTGMVVRVSADGAVFEAEARASVPVAASSEPAATGAPSPAPPAVEVVPEPGPLAGGMGLALGAGALFLGLAFAGLVIASRPERPSQLVVARQVRRASRGNPLQAMAQQATGFAERSLDRSGHRRGLERALELAGWNMRAGEFLLLAGTATFASFAVGILLGGPLVGCILAAVAAGSTRAAVQVAGDRRRAKFAAQLDQTLPLLAGSLRAGFGLLQALDAVARESESPTADEFRRLTAETRLGRDLDECLHAMAERVGNEDFSWVVEAIAIHQQVGGDLAEVLDRVHGTIRDRNRVRRQVSALSAEGRISGVILFALPIAMFVFMATVNRAYLQELTGSGLGVGLLIGGAVLMLVGGLWMRKITKLVY